MGYGPAVAWVLFAEWLGYWRVLGPVLFVGVGIVGLTAAFIAHFPSTVQRLGFTRFGAWAPDLVGRGRQVTGFSTARATLRGEATFGMASYSRRSFTYSTLLEPASAVMLHAARDLVVAGIPVAEAARRRGLSRSSLRRFIKEHAERSASAS